MPTRNRTAAALALPFVTLASLAMGTAFAQVVVTSTADIPIAQADCVTPGSEICTLRAALERVGSANPRRIVFALPGPGRQVIRLDPELGPLVWNTSGEIDGLTQTGAARRVGSDPNNPVDYVLTVGIAAPQFQTLSGPLFIVRGGGALKGLAFFDHDGVGVQLESGLVETSFFNTPDGANPGPRQLTRGVEVVSTNLGGSAQIRRSLFMGPGIGIELRDARPPGSQSLGVLPTLAENYFGTDSTGLLARALEYGVLAQIDAAPPIVSGEPRALTPSIQNSLFYLAERNAIRLRGVTPSIQDISIGYDASGARIAGVPPATQGAGMLIEGPTWPTRFNGGAISYFEVYGQRGPGVLLDDTRGPIRNMMLTPTRIAQTGAQPRGTFGNGGLGISLNPAAPAAPTPNDAGDADGGANGRQNHPVITGMRRALDPFGDERIAVGLTFESRPEHNYALMFFANSHCHPSGHGEAERLLSEFISIGEDGDSQLQTDAAGLFTGEVFLSPPINTALARLDGHRFVTAIAQSRGRTDGEDDPNTTEWGNTSEFSPCFDAANLDPPGQQLGFEHREYEFREGQTASVLVQRTGGTDGEVRVAFSTSDSSALAGRDYESVQRELVFANGIRGHGVQIPLRADDDVPQPTREFFVTLLTPMGGTGGATVDPFRAEARVRILDNDIRLSVTDSVGNAADHTMDFGAIEYGAIADGVITLANTGDVIIRFQSIDFTSGLADDQLREQGRTCGEFLDPGQSCTVTVRFAPAGTPVIAQGHLDIHPANGSSTSILISGRAPPLANLSIGMSRTPPNPQPGEAVTYAIEARNLGPSDAPTGAVSIELPPGLTLAAGLLQPSQGQVSVAAGTVTWEVGPLASGAGATLDFGATVDADTPQGTTLTVSASIGHADPGRVDQVVSNNTAAAAVVVGAVAADLRIENVEIRSPFNTLPNEISVPRSCTGADSSSCGRLTDEYRELRITVRNDGPDTSVAPLRLRIESGFCFDVIWERGENRWLARCQHDPVYESSLAATEIPPGGEVTLSREFWALERFDFYGTMNVSVTHGGFDPRSLNNSGLSDPVTIFPPADFVPNDPQWGGDADFRGACFIATAAYGSWMDPHVDALRGFRDRWLLTHAPGRAFVEEYYRHSPPVADWIATREWARAGARALLAPLVFAITQPLLAIALLVSGLLGYRRARLQPRTISSAGWRRL